LTDTLITVSVGSVNTNAAAVQILDVGQTAMIVNPSVVNTIWYGNNPALTSTYQNAIPLEPNASISLTAQDSPIYACAAPGVVTSIYVLPGASTFFGGNIFITNATLAISGSVEVTNTPSVDISNTPDVNVNSGTVDVTTSAPINVSAATVDVLPLKNISEIGSTSFCSAGALSAVTTFAMPSQAEGYLIECIPGHPGTEIFVADILITHLDNVSRVVGYEEVTTSNWENLGNDVTVIRGRLLGTSITVQANVASSTWINTVTGGSVTADGFNMSVYALPVYVPNTGKRVPIISASDGLLFASSNSVSLPATQNAVEFAGVIPDYTGQVIFSSYNGASGTTAAYQAWIKCWTVTNGSSAELADIYLPIQTAGSSVAAMNTLIALPSCFNTLSFINRSTVAQASVGASLTIPSPDQ
jgi:hypothetical protein